MCGDGEIASSREGPDSFGQRLLFPPVKPPRGCESWRPPCWYPRRPIQVATQIHGAALPNTTSFSTAIALPAAGSCPATASNAGIAAATPASSRNRRRVKALIAGKV